MQIAPGLILGLHLQRLRAMPTLWGFLAGTAVNLIVLILLHTTTKSTPRNT